jgi:hypothetical protein
MPQRARTVGLALGLLLAGTLTTGALPAGASWAKGKCYRSPPVMSLILDSHTGRVEGESIGSVTPNPGQLDAARQLSASPTAEVASNNGIIVGRVYENGSPPPKRGRQPPPPRVAVGFPVLAFSAAPQGLQITNIVARTITRRDGSFRLSLKPGHYWIAAKKKLPGGFLCGSQPVTVRARHRTRVNLVCGKI